MKLKEFRLEMESYRRAAGDEATQFKNSYIALDRMRDLTGITRDHVRPT